MSTQRMQVADLDEEALGKVKALEQNLGKCLVALAPQYDLSHLGGDELERVQELEQDLGVVLLAYDRP